MNEHSEGFAKEEMAVEKKRVGGGVEGQVQKACQ